jgi:hypothetical protein
MSMLNFDPKGVENAAKLAVSPIQRFANWVGGLADKKANEEKEKTARQEHFANSIEMHRQMRDIDVSSERRMLNMRTNSIMKLQAHAKDTGVATYEHQMSGIKTKGSFRAPEKPQEQSPAPSAPASETQAPAKPMKPEKPVAPAKPASTTSAKPKATPKPKGPKA